jgi:hypothetical protein
VTDHEDYPEFERRKMNLTPADLDAIKQVACACPHGMTAQDVFRLRNFLDWWDRVQMGVGSVVLKVIITLVVAIGILTAWVLNAGGRP